MAKDFILAKVTAGDQPGLVRCLGARAGDLVAQAMAANGDSVLAVFHPVIQGTDVIAQAIPWATGKALIVVHRHSRDV